MQRSRPWVAGLTVLSFTSLAARAPGELPTSDVPRAGPSAAQLIASPVMRPVLHLAEQETATGGVVPEPITFGIGSILWKTEGSDLAFEAYRYFAVHPPQPGGAPVRPFIADYATDASWYLTGNIQGSAQYRFNNSDSALYQGLLDYTGFTVAGAGAMMLISGAIIAAASPADQTQASADTNATVVVVGAVITAVGVAISALWWLLLAKANSETNHFTSNLSGTFELRRRGKVEATIAVPATHLDKRAGDFSTDFISRDKMLAPVWDSVLAQVSAKMAEKPITAEERSP